jgi:hypothetical protein
MEKRLQKSKMRSDVWSMEEEAEDAARKPTCALAGMPAGNARIKLEGRLADRSRCVRASLEGKRRHLFCVRIKVRI